MKTSKEQQKAFALEQIAPYFKNPKTCGMNKKTKMCTYLINGRMCVIGKNFNPGVLAKYMYSGLPIDKILKFHNNRQKYVFKEESAGILTGLQWQLLQNVHDKIATNQPTQLKSCITLLGLFTYEELVQYSSTLKN